MLHSVVGRVARRIHVIRHKASMSATARAIVNDRLTYLSPTKLNRLEGALREVLRNDVRGDFVEFGIALGGSTIIIGKQARNSGRRFHGFDVFGMIPPPTSEKDGEKAKVRYEAIVNGASDGIGGDTYYGYRKDLYGEVCRTLANHGLPVDGQAISLHKGLFEDTLPAAPLGPIAFAHIDCDFYDAVRYCLNATADRMSIGGIMVIDDYHDFRGCKTATDEFLAERAGFALEDGENVIVRRMA